MEELEHLNPLPDAALGRPRGEICFEMAGGSSPFEHRTKARSISVVMQTKRHETIEMADIHKKDEKVLGERS